MALSEDLRTRVVEAVVVGGLSRNAAAKRFGVSIASAVRWVWRFQATGEISPAPTGGDRRSDRIEAHGDYLLGLIGRQPDITLWRETSTETACQNVPKKAHSSADDRSHKKCCPRGSM